MLDTAPSFNIPCLKFVEAGIFVKMGSEVKHVKSSAARPSRSFLLEEKIPVPEGGEFIKYVHNASAVTALFLCACQHLQYDKTQGVAFVSDFQGCGELLTDAQIMTSP